MYVHTIDLIGQRFGNLTVVEKIGSNKHNKMVWRCKCDCGGIKNARTGDLLAGTAHNCGCSHNKHMQTANGKATRIYRIWKNMKARCYSKNTLAFKYYGYRGIEVCKEWHEFAPFHRWALANGYTDELTLDRVNNDGNYEPGNCRWATRKEQAQHRRPNGSVIRNHQLVERRQQHERLEAGRKDN